MDLRSDGSILLVSCYELGHQPLGVALPLGFLRQAGYPAATLDIAVEKFDDDKARNAKLVAISVPMHTALRLGVRVIQRVREVNADCQICCYGLYAALNADYLLQHGADACIGGEYEGPLVALANALQENRSTNIPGVIRQGQPAAPNLERLPFVVPERDLLPPLERYAHLQEDKNLRTAGYVEASRGCLHLCTHCPIPPVYEGRFFIIPEEIVLEDIRRQVRAGATHITFGDPDFLNGPKHALRVVRAMHREFPELTFDFTAKVEHLLKRGEGLPEFAAAGCLFITSAVESFNNDVLKILDKGHTRDDIVAALQLVRDAGISLRPTFVAFTPWTSRDDYCDMLSFVQSSDMIDQVDPVQYTIRLLIPPGSWLAEHEATLPFRGTLDEAAFSYRWNHPDPSMDRLQKDVARLVEEHVQAGEDVSATFRRVCELAFDNQPLPELTAPSERRAAPRLTESWFC